MAAPAVIAGSFADYRLIKSRGCLQIIIEIPVEAQASAFDVLGYPMPGIEIPVAVARLNGIPPDVSLTPKARYAAMTAGEQAVQRAGILAGDLRFQAWAQQQCWPLRSDGFTEENAADFIREQCCGGASRKLIAEDPEAMDKFIALETAFKIAVGEIAEPR